MFIITIINNDGKTSIEKTYYPNIFGLMYSVQKCEIKSFTVELA